MKKYLLLIMINASVACGLDYIDSDFATQVIDYTPGTGSPSDWIDFHEFNVPTTALGAPTFVTTGDDDDPTDDYDQWGYKGIPVDTPVDVNPVYGPFRWYEVVSIGKGGQLTIKFDHHVADDRNNLYGIDFIIFGNARQQLPNQTHWTLQSDPETTLVIGSANSEYARVFVSQDGINYIPFSNGPFADDFAPTAARKWDNLNNTWGPQLDPTRPVDPSLKAVAMNGLTVAQMIDSYDGAAGGTGFDLASVGLEWIQYVRIVFYQPDPRYLLTADIDAVADVSACGDYRHPFPAGDQNFDCKVNMLDYAVAAQQWLTDTAPMMDVVNTWLECTWDCD